MGKKDWKWTGRDLVIGGLNKPYINQISVVEGLRKTISVVASNSRRRTFRLWPWKRCE